MLIDIPQVAYEMEDGTRDRSLEQKLEKDLERALSRYPYSENNPHVR